MIIMLCFYIIKTYDKEFSPLLFPILLNSDYIDAMHMWNKHLSKFSIRFMFEVSLAHYKGKVDDVLFLGESPK